LTTWAIISFLAFVFGNREAASSVMERVLISIGGGLALTLTLVILSLLADRKKPERAPVLTDPIKAAKWAASNGGREISLAPLKETPSPVEQCYDQLLSAPEPSHWMPLEDRMCEELLLRLYADTVMATVG
jgi:hypothetical protein